LLRNFALSILFHAALLIVAYVGLPSFHDRELLQDVPMSVEIVNVTDVTNLPTKSKKPEPKKEAKAEPKPPPPKKPPAPPPAPKGSVQEPPAPEPLPEPKDEKVAVIVNPEPKPKKETKPKPKPEQKPKKVESKKRAPTPIPPRKPKAPDQFASVLKTLEELKTQPRPEKTEDEKAEPKKDFASMMENALDSPKPRTDVGPELTISEIDLVRQQIQRCWNLPAGAKDAHKMIISIRMVMNPDGSVQQARILDQAQMSTNPFYRTMAESALRATLNPRCQPFRLPPEKFERWKTMKLTFDPRDMLGL